MPRPDEIRTKVGEGIELLHQGERAAASALFAQLWSKIGEHGDPLHRCALAHWMADAQDEPREELAWDLRALEAVGSISEGRAQEASAAVTVSGFYPSLHLNLGEDYRKLGDQQKAAEHLVLGRAHVERSETTATAG